MVYVDQLVKVDCHLQPLILFCGTFWVYNGVNLTVTATYIVLNCDENIWSCNENISCEDDSWRLRVRPVAGGWCWWKAGVNNQLEHLNLCDEFLA